MVVLLRPLDCFSLRLEGGEKVVGMVLDHVIIDVRKHLRRREFIALLGGAAAAGREPAS